MKTLDNYITEQLEKHVNIDYEIFEHAGLYDGLEDLARFLTNKIKSHQEKKFRIIYKDTDRELSKFKNIFFKTIVLNCERSNGYDNEAEYQVNDEIDYLKEFDQFLFVSINIDLSIKHDSTNVYMILIHELTHAWDNFNHIKRYKKSYEKTTTGDIYGNITKSMDDNELIGKILYFINPIEINAWSASFAGYLYNNIEDKTIDDPQKALKIIKDSPLYQNYINMGEYIDAIYNDTLPKEFILKCCSEYNKIYNKNYTVEKIKKVLKNRYICVMNHINSNIGKICARYVKSLAIKDKNPNAIKFKIS